MVFIQHCFHLEKHYFHLDRQFSCSPNISNWLSRVPTQSSLVIQNSFSSDYPVLYHMLTLFLYSQGTPGSFQLVRCSFVPYGKFPVVSEDAPSLFPELFPIGLPSSGREICSMICLRCTWFFAISYVTYWKDSRVMPLATESLSVASTTWKLVIWCDMLLEDEEEYLEDDPYTEVFIVEIESSSLY